MKNIGSKQAELLARKRFGDRAFVLRQGKQFQVRVMSVALGGMALSFLKGKGKSWEAALVDAGIIQYQWMAPPEVENCRCSTIPPAAPYLPPTVQHIIDKDGMPDTDAIDTDIPATMPEDGGGE